MVKNCRIRLFVSTEYTNVADRQMDRQRRCDGIAHAYAEHRSAKMVPEKRSPGIVFPGNVLSAKRNPGHYPPGHYPPPRTKAPRTKSPPKFDRTKAPPDKSPA